MTNEELRRLCERVIKLEFHPGSFCDGEFKYRSGEKFRLDDGNGNWIMEWRDDEMAIWPEVKDAIPLYLYAASPLANQCLKLLAQCEAMRCALVEIEKICDKPWGEMYARVWTIDDDNYQAWHVRDIAHEALSQLGERT